MTSRAVDIHRIDTKSKTVSNNEIAFVACLTRVDRAVRKHNNFDQDNDLTITMRAELKKSCEQAHRRVDRLSD